MSNLLSVENMREHLDALERGFSADLLLKLLVLTGDPTLIYIFRARMKTHLALLQTINPELQGSQVTFAGGITRVDIHQYRVDATGGSLEPSGYQFDGGAYLRVSS